MVSRNCITTLPTTVPRRTRPASMPHISRLDSPSAQRPESCCTRVPKFHHLQAYLDHPPRANPPQAPFLTAPAASRRLQRLS
eukprot:5828523-Prymnesium_polylepis.1